MRAAEGRPARFRRSEPACLLLLAALLAALAHAAVLDAPFQYDDWNVIVDAPSVHGLGAWWASMPGIRPLLKLSHALCWRDPPDPARFRAVNDLVHLLAAGLACALLREIGRWLPAPSAPGPSGLPGAAPAIDDRARLAAAIGAGIFLLHPAQTEAVSYVSGRSVALCGLFALASAFAWMRARARPPGPARRRLDAAAHVAFALALLCKEVALALPAVLTLLAWQCPADGADRRARADWFAATRGHWLIAGLALLLAAALPRYRDLLAVSLDTRGPFASLLTQAGAVLHLASLLLRFDRLNADPDLPVVTTPEAGALLRLGVVGLAALLALLAARRHRVAAFALLWFLLWLAPTNSVLARLDVVNDRQLYLALIGPAWALGLGLTRWPARRARRAVVLLLFAVLAAGSAMRNRVYASEIAFWEDVERKSPGKARAQVNLGHAYALACRVDEAEARLRRALALDAGDARAAVDLVLLRRGLLPGLPEGCRPPGGPVGAGP